MSSGKQECVCYKEGMNERLKRSIAAWREASAGRPGDTRGIRLIRRTAIVWVPIVGIGAAVGIKAVGWLIIRMVVAAFAWILRTIFH